MVLEHCSQPTFCLAMLMIDDHVKDSSIPSFMKYTLKILSAASSVLIEMVFLLCPIEVIHYNDSFPNIKSLFCF